MRDERLAAPGIYMTPGRTAIRGKGDDLTVGIGRRSRLLRSPSSLDGRLRHG